MGRAFSSGFGGGGEGQLLRLCTQGREHFGQAAESAHLRTGDEGRLLCVFSGDDDPVVPGSNRGFHGGQDARNRANRPVEAQLSQKHAVSARMQLLLGLQCGHHNGQVEGRSALRQGRRSQVDGESMLSQGNSGVLGGRTNTFFGLVESGIRKSQQHETGKALRDIGLNVHNVSAQTHESDRVGA